MSRATVLTDFSDGSDDEVTGPEFPDTCTAPDCGERSDAFRSLCFEHQSHKRRPDGEVIAREDGYSPNQPECGYCGREARGDDPRRCLACGLLDASEVIGA